MLRPCSRPGLLDRRQKPNIVQVALKFPRCDSSNTKFSYYNNYNLSQTHYFCKTYRRYQTNGGSLRNVPVGGGCKKTREPGELGTNLLIAVCKLLNPLLPLLLLIRTLNLIDVLPIQIKLVFQPFPQCISVFSTKELMASRLPKLAVLCTNNKL